MSLPAETSNATPDAVPETPTSGPTSKLVRFQDRDLTIHGRAEDPYFQNFSFDDKTNDFLIGVMEQAVRDDAVMLDVGANIGATTAVLGAAAPRGRVYCFEPSPTAFPLLQETIKANGLDNCTPFQLAVGASKGELSFFENPISASASHLTVERQTMGGSNSTVAVTTIDDFVKEHRIERLDLIKIDVEGLERDVLTGAKETISRLKPDVFIEFNSFTLIAYGDENPRRFLEYLMASFPHVYWFADGRARAIVDDMSAVSFLHLNLVHHGCVDDLYCCHHPLLSTWLSKLAHVGASTGGESEAAATDPE